MVQFRPLNLLADFCHLGTFDVVFCRNVLIYFDQETKIGVLDRIARIIDRDGYLVLGAAETVVGLTDELQAGARPARALCAESGEGHAKRCASSRRDENRAALTSVPRRCAPGRIGDPAVRALERGDPRHLVVGERKVESAEVLRACAPDSRSAGSA